MGANTFMIKAEGKTAADAFRTARKEAQYMYGHNGYTGTIAEKDDYTEITLPKGRDPKEYADELIEKGDPRIEDTWGDAGCIKIAKKTWLFFGWAKS